MLKGVYPGEDLRERLVEALTGAGISRESADRTARNWLSGDSTPSDRVSIYRVAFGLKLEVEATNRLLCAATDYGIHARDPAEVAYLFALRTGRDFAEATRLIERCSALLGEQRGGGPSTQMLGAQVRELTTDEEFISWYAAHAGEFSLLHEAAYDLFMQALRQLIGEGDDFSLDYVCNVLLQFRKTVPQGRERKNISELERVLRRLWPNATAIRKMKERKIDVSRKALLLLYVLCDGVMDETAYDPLDEAYVPPRVRLKGARAVAGRPARHLRHGRARPPRAVRLAGPVLLPVRRRRGHERAHGAGAVLCVPHGNRFIGAVKPRGIMGPCQVRGGWPRATNLRAGGRAARLRARLPRGSGGGHGLQRRRIPRGLRGRAGRA